MLILIKNKQEKKNHQKENLLLDTKALQNKTKRLDEVINLIHLTYEDKVLNKIPEDICISLLNNYQKEKEISQITERIEVYRESQKIHKFACFNPKNNVRTD